jgi:glycosyltransferase involved in cell wall biosynthesis
MQCRFFEKGGQKVARHSCEVSVVIPAYNESERIERTLQVTVACLKKQLASFELIVVDDGSRDGTGEAAARAVQRLRLGKLVRVISYSPNQGKGWALRQGAEIARGSYIAFLDADLDISPQHIPDYLAVLRKEKADAVIASKRHADSQLEYAKSRVWISNIYYWFNRIFFRLDIKDTQSGMKLFRREVLDRAMPRLLGKRFAFDLELLVTIRLDGGKIIEQPVTIENHDKFGRIGILSLWHAFVDTLAIFYRANLQRFYKRMILPKHAGDKGQSRPSIAICVFAAGYGKKIEAFCRYLATTMEPPPVTIILAP